MKDVLRAIVSRLIRWKQEREAGPGVEGASRGSGLQGGLHQLLPAAGGSGLLGKAHCWGRSGGLLNKGGSNIYFWIFLLAFQENSTNNCFKNRTLF